MVQVVVLAILAVAAYFAKQVVGHVVGHLMVGWLRKRLGRKREIDAKGDDVPGK